MIRAPSIKALCQLKDVGTDTAKLIRQIIKAKTRYELLTIAENATGRDMHQVRLDYINHTGADLEATMLDELLGTFGVEAIWRNTDDREPLALYLNAGDTYAATLAYWHGRWQITTYGDIVESEGI